MLQDKITELETKIAEVERKAFLNQMDDHWSDYNFKVDNECREQLKALKEELEEVKNG